MPDDAASLAPPAPAAPGPGWRMASRVLFVLFLLSAGLNLAGTSAGFATNHLADLVVPAWLYLATRGLADRRPRRSLIQRLVGPTPERAAVVLFLASTATEISQIYWPRGFFSGYFDPLDIAAYGIGILPFYLADRFTARGGRT